MARKNKREHYKSKATKVDLAFFCSGLFLRWIRDEDRGSKPTRNSELFKPVFEPFHVKVFEGQLAAGFSVPG